MQRQRTMLPPPSEPPAATLREALDSYPEAGTQNTCEAMAAQDRATVPVLRDLR